MGRRGSELRSAIGREASVVFVYSTEQWAKLGMTRRSGFLGVGFQIPKLPPVMMWVLANMTVEKCVPLFEI